MVSKDDRLRRLISEQAAEWYAAQAEGPLGREQAGEFMRWLQLSPLHVAEYLRTAELARGLEQAARVDATPLAELLADPGEPVTALPAGGSQLPRAAAPARPARSARRLGACVAVLLAAVVIGLAGWQWLASGVTTITVETGRGQERTLYLPDHTLLRLDAESRVAVRFSRHEREVTVDRGQAYFDVAADRSRPFRVRVGSVAIRDIGTVFDVYRHAATATVTVLRGHVQVWGTGVRATSTDSGMLLAKLGPDEQVTVSRYGRVLAYGEADPWQALAWMHGRVTFEDTPVSDVAAQFNRYNATQIIVANPTIGATRITGTFQSRSMHAFVRFLEGLRGVVVTARGDRITVGPPPSNR